MFRAADHVAHGPTGETWLLACDEDNGEVIPCGWPETYARASDCTLVKAATDEERMDILRLVGREGMDGLRASRARHQLGCALAAEPPAGMGGRA